MVGSFEGLKIFTGVDFSLFDFLFSSFNRVNAGDVVAEVLESDFFDRLVFVGSVMEGSRKSIGDDGEEVFIDLFGVFGIVLVLDMVDEELKVVQEQVLVVCRGFEIVFEQFARKLHIPEVLYHELSILNHNIRHYVDVGCKHC